MKFNSCRPTEIFTLRERERELEREGVGYSYINGAIFGGNYYSYTVVIGYLAHKFVFEKMLQKIYNMSSKMFIFKIFTSV